MGLLERVKDLRENRMRLVEQGREVLEHPAGADGVLSAEEDARFARIHEDIAAGGEEIEKLERQLDAERAMGESRGRRVVEPIAEVKEIAAAQGEQIDGDGAFGRWAKQGAGGLRPEERAAFGHKAEQGNGTSISFRALSPKLELERRAQSVGTDTEGGFTVPEGFYNSLTSALLAFGGMRQVRSMILPTASGNDLPMPTEDDTGNAGVLLAENTQDAEQDVTFASVILGAYKYTSKIIRVSHELMNDSAFDIGGFLGRKIGERIGRITNTQFTTGTGTAQPNGVVTASTLGKTAAGVAAITYEELLDLKHSVDPAYRGDGEWMFNDAVLLAIKKVKDGSNRYLWQASISVGSPNTIDGDNYVVNQDMAALATGNKTVLYGDFSLFVIRDVESIRVLRLVERYADFDQVAFVGFSRHDSDLLDAGTNPIKHLIQA